ncbi:response regulator [Candidatus Hodarchaeum mangrovi]
MVNVFIIDDDESIVFLFQEFLGLNGHKVIAKAFDGEEAIQVFKNLLITSFYPDIILIDYRMPKKDGLEVTKELLSLKSDLKIIFVSADSSIKEKAFKAGIISFLEKPTDLEFLNNTIKQAVSK